MRWTRTILSAMEAREFILRCRVAACPSCCLHRHELLGTQGERPATSPEAAVECKTPLIETYYPPIFSILLASLVSHIKQEH